MAAEVGTKAVVAALLANTGIAAAKFVGFALTRSSSMLAEAIHSVADAGNQALLLLGVRRATKRPSQEHPFGYGRERYFWSFIVALVIFTLGAGFAVYEGIDKVRNPHEIKGLWWAVGILGVAIVLESLSFRTALREARPLRGETSWWQFIRRSRSPELPVVLLEDSAPWPASCWHSLRSCWRTSPATPSGTGSARCASGCCWEPSPYSWLSSCRAC